MPEIIPYLLQVIGSLLALIVVILAWVGNRIHSRLDEISKSLSAIDKDLRIEINGLDNRVTSIESRCALRHGEHL